MTGCTFAATPRRVVVVASVGVDKARESLHCHDKEGIALSQASISLEEAAELSIHIDRQGSCRDTFFEGNLLRRMKFQLTESNDLLARHSSR